MDAKRFKELQEEADDQGSGTCCLRGDELEELLNNSLTLMGKYAQEEKERIKAEPKLEEIAQLASAVVDMFDQADTGSAIRDHGSFSSVTRRFTLINAIDKLRYELAKTKYKSTLPRLVKGRPEVE